jgi:chorismate synthase
MLRFLDAGESHGKALVAIIEGLPSNVKINIDNINTDLSRRQKGYGRGDRMKIEKDTVEVWSGVRGDITTGNPVTLVIFNKDYENWKTILNNNPKEEDRIGIARPGHGDYVGFLKYNTGDIRNTIERTSARETAIRTAVGAFSKEVLSALGIKVRSKVHSIGKHIDDNVDIFQDNTYDKIEKSEVRVFNSNVEKHIKEEIDKLKIEGDTIGGSIKVEVEGVPVGLGSYAQYDRKLDGALSMAVMSVQGIKAIEFGNIIHSTMVGSSFNDEMKIENKVIKRVTNNCGGIEAGVSNGENIIITAYMKPIPTVKKNLKTVDLIKMENTSTRYERSDVCGVVPASIVLENVIAFEILKAILYTYPSDDFYALQKYMKESRN